MCDINASTFGVAGVRRLLKKLSFIFDLPTRLARAVELGAHAQVLNRNLSFFTSSLGYGPSELPRIELGAYAQVPPWR